MPLLSVNIDHVATVRQARYRDLAKSGVEFGEPDAARAMHEAELGGADGITVHLREDRRHITDRDVDLIRSLARVRFNLEMAATDEMVAIALRIKPHTAMLVPEGRDEVTTEGGLDVAGQRTRLREIVKKLRDGGLAVSAFIDAEAHQIGAAAEIGFQICEIHTGPYAHAFFKHGGAEDPRVEKLLDRIAQAGTQIRNAGMRFNAGHALSYANVTAIARLDGLHELHIGHAIVSRAIFVGLREAVAEMKRLCWQASVLTNPAGA